MAFFPKNPEDPKVDLTPMVDVVFLLLIFFMISTTFIETPGIPIKLPQSSSEVLAKTPEEVKVYLSRSGRVFHDDRELSMEQLASLLSGYRGKAAGMTFLLMADRESRHGEVVQVMDLAREAGFGKLAIGTEKKRRRP